MFRLTSMVFSFNFYSLSLDLKLYNLGHRHDTLTVLKF